MLGMTKENVRKMKDTIAQYFTGIEAEKRKVLNSIMEDWRNEVSSSKIIFKDNGNLLPGDRYFAADGFLPGYYKQEKKVLFIGREARFVNTSEEDEEKYQHDYLAAIIDWYKNLKQGNFNRHILQMVQVIRSEGRIEFEDLQGAKAFAKELVEKCDLGFAIMNISKYSNDAGDGGNADPELMNHSLEDSHLDKRNFFKEEIELLDPDIIITGNLWDPLLKIDSQYTDKCFGENVRANPVGYYPNKNSPDGILYEYRLNGKKVMLIDIYHFSRPGVSDKDYFYSPVKNLLFSDRDMNNK
jgi:hypothetical protein